MRALGTSRGLIGTRYEAIIKPVAYGLKVSDIV